MKNIKLGKDSVPVIGQGTWALGEDRAKMSKERDALRRGIELGMTLVDTAEMYGEGLCEEFVGDAIKGYKRESLYIVSKVYPQNSGQDKIFRSCENSLHRLGTDYLDLYLLHWRGKVPLEETVHCMEELKRRGMIREWGVSNFDTNDIKELLSIPDGNKCIANQVLYHLASRGTEYDLLPLMRAEKITLMAYCPLAQAGLLSKAILNRPEINKIASRVNVTPAQVMLAFTIRDGNTIAIPKSSSISHIIENAEAANITFCEEDIKYLDYAFPAPTRKTPLDVE